MEILANFEDLIVDKDAMSWLFGPRSTRQCSIWDLGSVYISYLHGPELAFDDVVRRAAEFEYTDLLARRVERRISEWYKPSVNFLLQYRRH
jgi:hypothetical protein